MEFKPFPKIENIKKLRMSITQKIHGSNAQIFISKIDRDNHTPPSHRPIYVHQNGVTYLVQAGSRNRWLSPGKDTDNFGFAQWVEDNKDELFQFLGPGQHFGEWAGPGINSGEGLEEKTFVLFDFWKYPPERPLPPNVKVVPVLYDGKLDPDVIDQVAEDLKTNGSKLVPGFMRPEGMVVTLGGVRYKYVFDAEETQWKKAPEKKKVSTNGPDVSHLLQPIRLEKLLSRDSRYIDDYPASLVTIVKDYVQDLIDEGQICGDKDEVKAIRKELGSQLYPFIKASVSERVDN